MRSFKLDPRLDEWLVKSLAQLGYSVDQPKKLADAVLKLSDHFVARQGVTPWGTAETQAAYLAYFFPLGYVRGRAVGQELDRLRGNVGFAQVFEMGSGPGNVSAAILDSVRQSEFNWEVQEIATEAYGIHRRLFQEVYGSRVHLNRASRPSKSIYQLGIFSYVLNEIKESPNFDPFETVIILEPSTQNNFAAFLGHREALKNRGFQILAPCTHQGVCPLSQSRDWCHDRVAFEAPAWFQEMERHLPMKNRTVTFSYLIASKKIRPHEGRARLTGDLLVEKGKSRILICRGPKREFLSWLHRDIPDQDLYRGDLFELDQPFEEKANEIRIKTHLQSDPSKTKR